MPNDWDWGQEDILAAQAAANLYLSKPEIMVHSGPTPETARYFTRPPSGRIEFGTTKGAQAYPHTNYQWDVDRNQRFTQPPRGPGVGGQTGANQWRVLPSRQPLTGKLPSGITSKGFFNPVISAGIDAANRLQRPGGSYLRTPTAAALGNVGRFITGMPGAAAQMLLHSPDVGIDSDRPGRIPAAHHGPVWSAPTPMETSSYRGMKISHPGTEQRFADTLTEEQLAEITATIDPDSAWNAWATEGVPGPGSTVHDYDPQTGTTIISPPTTEFPPSEKMSFVLASGLDEAARKGLEDIAEKEARAKAKGPGQLFKDRKTDWRTQREFRNMLSRAAGKTLGGIGLLAYSEDAGAGSDIPGIRGPGGAPAWGAHHLGTSPLSNQNITVANTIQEALARADEAIAGMGLTGAAAQKASALASAELGYLSADQLQGLQAAQQAQEQAAQAAAAAAVESFSGGWGGGDDESDPDDTMAGFGTVSNEAIAEVMEQIAIDNIIAEALEGGYGRGGSVEADYGDVGGGGEFGGTGGGGMGGFGGWT